MHIRKTEPMSNRAAQMLAEFARKNNIWVEVKPVSETESIVTYDQRPSCNQDRRGA